MARRGSRNGDPEEPVTVISVPPPPDGMPAGLLDERDDDDTAGGTDPLGDMLALKDEAYRDVTWYVWRLRQPGEVRRIGKAAGPTYVATVVGPIDLDELAKQIGGGNFRLCGYRRGTKIVERPIEIEGPRKMFDTLSQTTVAPAADMAPILSAMERMVDRIEQRLATVQPAPAPAAAPFSIKDVIEVAKMLKPEVEPAREPNGEAVKTMVDMLRQGIELGAQREPSSGTDWGAVVEKALPLAERFVAGLAARRGQVPGRAVPPNRPAASRAEVLEGPTSPAPAAPPPPAESQQSVRMAAVVDSLARAIAAMGTDSERDPGDFAATVETVLEPAELAMMRMAGTDKLMAELAQLAESYPVFTTPQARAFVEAVLGELNRTDEPE